MKPRLTIAAFIVAVLFWSALAGGIAIIVFR